MKILIELPTWLGDCVMATPAIENVMHFYPTAQLTLIGSSVAVEVLKPHPRVIRAQVLEKQYKRLYQTAKALGNFDVFFSFRGSLRSQFFKYFVSSKKKFKFNKSQFQNRHQVEKYNDFVGNSLGCDFPVGRLVLYSEKKNTKKSKPILGINPGASYGSAKRWYPEEFAKVITQLSTQYDTVILGSEKEFDIAQDIEQFLIKKGIKNYQNLVGKTTITELVEQISILDLLLTGDSGPMHVGAAFGVPTVAIFGPTKDNETSQWMNEKSVIVKKNLECQPCMRRTCPLKHHHCMRKISAKDALQALAKLL